jgi:hypothetical protein
VKLGLSMLEILSSDMEAALRLYGPPPRPWRAPSPRMENQVPRQGHTVTTVCAYCLAWLTRSMQGARRRVGVAIVKWK